MQAGVGRGSYSTAAAAGVGWGEVPEPRHVALLSTRGTRTIRYIERVPCIGALSLAVATIVEL